MYSRSRNATAGNEEPFALPARYSGVRFNREKRSDGRDIVIEAPMREPETAPRDAVNRTPRAGAPQKAPLTDSLSKIFGNIGEDDILLAALIMILAGEGDNREAILLLLLLLCIR